MLSKAIKAVSPRRAALNQVLLGRVLKVQDFTNKEIQNSFQRIVQAGVSNENIENNQTKNISDGVVEVSRDVFLQGFQKLAISDCKLHNDKATTVENALLACDSKSYNNHIDEFASRLLAYSNSTENNNKITLSDYEKGVRKVGETLDGRIWSLASSFLLTGVSIGIIIPCMPLLIKELNLTSLEYGMIISAFGLARLFGNIPMGYFVDHYGRKPAIIVGLGLCSVGLGGMSVAMFPGFGLPWIIACRLLFGFGVSSFMGGTQTYIADISTPLNRTRSMSPTFSGFQAGAMVGPAMGGVMMDKFGLSTTFSAVAAMIGGLTALNQSMLTETKTFSAAQVEERKKLSVTTGIRESTKEAWSLWRSLLTCNDVKNVVLIQSVYSMVLSGAQMTILPLFLIAEPLLLSASQMGGFFAYMALVSFLCAQPTAKLSDKFGKVPMILAACSMASVSTFALSSVETFPELLLAMTPFALGTTIMPTACPAYMAEITKPHQRPQALSLIRVSGDVGFLTGALCSGVLSKMLSMTETFQANGVMVLAGMSVFGYRWWKSRKSKLNTLE